MFLFYFLFHLVTPVNKKTFNNQSYKLHLKYTLCKNCCLKLFKYQSTWMFKLFELKWH